jgi:flagellum-specific peptidoglycan hydrolase FlgJ
MYCEGKFEHNSYSHVEHIKPKAKFPELKFSWDNLGFSCQVCNTNKGEKYNETTPFIDPYSENPEDYIVFLLFYLFPKQGSEQGEYTIKELDLNRPNLIERRKERIDKLNVMINATYRTSSENLRNQAIMELKAEADKGKEYSAMVKSVLIAQGIL